MTDYCREVHPETWVTPQQCQDYGCQSAQCVRAGTTVFVPAGHAVFVYPVPDDLEGSTA